MAQGTSNILPVMVVVYVTIANCVQAVSNGCAQGETFVNCTSVGLTEIPHDVPGHTQRLEIAGNKITNISKSYLPYEELKFLNLSDNLITTITRGTFHSLNSLETLDLSRNRLTGNALEDSVFEGLGSVRFLSLERNPLQRIKTETFSFTDLLDLEHLDLSHCQIKEIEGYGLFLPSLKYLDFSWNDLEAFTDDIFKVMTSLVTLDLSHNRISVIHDIPTMPDLQTWYLDYNEIETLTVQEEIEYNAENLENLYLRNNKIRRFGPEDLPLDLYSLKVLDMSDNELQCDCKMTWTAKQNLGIEGKTIIMKCDFPPDMKGKDLLTLKDSDLVCRTPLVKTLFIIAISCTGAVILVITVYCVIRWRRSRRLYRKARKGDFLGNFTAVYTRDEEDIRVAMSDSKHLVEKDREFDV